jgi:NCS1 nucleoside transporter family
MRVAAAEHHEIVEFDRHGIEPLPDADRDSTGWHQFWIWAGANIAPINWILGTLGPVLGLSLVETIVVVAIGNVVGCMLIGFFAVLGHRTGVPGMVLTRAAFGRRGGYLPAFFQWITTMSWLAVNTWVVLDLSLALLHEIGYDGGTGTKYVIALSLMAIQLVISVYGFDAIRQFEKWTVPVAASVMVVMTILAWTNSKVAWTTSTAHGGDKVTAITQLTTAIGIGWGISWITYGADYGRYCPRTISSRSVFGWVAIANFVPTVWLAALGASIASTGASDDPAQLVTHLYGALSIPILLLVLHGPIATNIVNMFSSSLALLALDVRPARWKATLVVGVIGTAFLVLFIQAGSFASKFDSYLASLVIWYTAWGAVVVADWALRRGRYDIPDLYAEPSVSRYGDVNYVAIAAFLIGIVAAWAWEYGLVSVMQGPIARATGNVDLSWLTGGVVASGIYYFAMRARFAEAPAPEVARADA